MRGWGEGARGVNNVAEIFTIISKIAHVVSNIIVLESKLKRNVLTFFLLEGKSLSEFLGL